MDEIPIVRHFVACKEITATPGVRDVTITSLIHSIVRLPGEPFPCVRESMALFALLTNGRGSHDFALELTVFENGTERRVFRSGARQVNLGPDPTVVHGMPMPLRNVVFDEPGQYTFHLLCDDQPIAEEKIEVR
jgi:hypothetical protein